MVGAAASASVLLLVVFISNLGQAWWGPSVPELLLERACRSRGLAYPSAQCDADTASQAVAAARAAFLSLAVLIPNFLSVGLVAAIADAVGRRPALVLGLVGFAAAAAAIVLLPGSEVCLTGQKHDHVDFASGSGSTTREDSLGKGCIDGFWLLLGATAFLSLTGGSKGITSIYFTVMADLTAELSAQSTALGFAAVEAASFAGAAPGLVLAGYAADWFGLQRSFSLALAAFIGCVVLLSCLPETRHVQVERNRSRQSTSANSISWRANPLGTLLVLSETPIARRAWAVDLLGGCAMAGSQSIYPLYMKQVDGLSDVENGYLQTVWSLAILVGLLVVFPVLQRYLSAKELLVLAWTASAATTAAWGLLSLPAFQGWRFTWGRNDVPVWPFLMQAACVLNAWSYSSLRTTIARSFPPTKVATAIGAFSTSNIICAALGRLLWAKAYGAHFGACQPGMLMWVAGLLILACVPILLTMPPPPEEQPHHDFLRAESAKASVAAENRLLNRPLIRPSISSSPRASINEIMPTPRACPPTGVGTHGRLQ